MKRRGHSHTVIHLMLVISIMWLAASEIAQAQSTIAVSVDGVDWSAHPTTRALVTVADENGIPVRGLDAKAFQLSEDGGAAFSPDKVQVVANQKAAVSVMIVIDLSGTMRGRPLQAAKEAIGKFLEALLNEANDPDRAAFIGFTQKVDPTAESITDAKREVAFTNDMGKLLNVINFVDVDNGTGGTPLYDALFRAVKITAQQPGRRAILLVTDGKDQGSTLADSDPINEANRQRIPIFSVGLSTGRLDTQYLQRLAVRTGGQFQSAPTPDQLTQLLQNVLAQLKEQYVLTYSSHIPQVDGRSHTLNVQVTSPKGVNSAKFAYTLGQAAAPTPTEIPAATETVTPQPTVAPTATAEPQPAPVNLVQSLISNPALMIAAAAAALLLILIVVVAIILIARSKGAESAAYDQTPYLPSTPDAGTFAGVAPSKATGGPTVMPAVSPTSATIADQRAGLGAGTQHAGPGPAAPTGARTQLAPPGPSGPAPFGAQPAPFPPPAVPGKPTSAGTELAPPGPSSPTPFGAQPASFPPPAAPMPFAGQPTPFQPPVGPGRPFNEATPLESSEAVSPGGTVIIQRKPLKGRLVSKDNPAWQFEIDKPSATVGRAPGNTCVVQHPTVSRQHATIKIEGNEFRLYDLGSANGTLVNGERVRDPIALRDGMTIRFGEAEFTFNRIA